MDESILNNIKRLLGPNETYNHFDLDIITHINSTLMTLNQLGVGPKEGFMITGPDETWADFIGPRKDLADIKSYVYNKVRLVFDPPQNSFLVEAIKEAIKESVWRINNQVESGV